MSFKRPSPLHVAAGALLDDDRVLIAQRPPGKRQAGRWEFPGGKLEPGETPRQALARELYEELGVTVMGYARPLIRVQHVYPFGDVLIDMWVVKRFAGEPAGLDGQALRWCPMRDLDAAELLPADRPIIAALRLPERLAAIDAAAYSLLPEEPGKSDARLHGRVADSPAAARRLAALASTGFLAMHNPLPEDEVRALCAAVPLPIYVRAASLEAAWVLGATGLNEL